MTNDELAARVVVLEVLAVTAMGIIFANAGPDPGKQKTVGVLNVARAVARTRLSEHSPEIAKAGETYLDEIWSEISENVDRLRPNDPR